MVATRYSKEAKEAKGSKRPKNPGKSPENGPDVSMIFEFFPHTESRPS